jgi:hypothetical protein
VFGYRVRLNAPVESMHVAVRNVGRDVGDKDGVFTFRLVGDDGVDLTTAEVGLPVSARLGKSYRYLMSTPAGELMVIGDVSATRPFVEVEVAYPGEFTAAPLEPDDLGPLFLTLPTARGCVVRVLRHEVFQRSGADL